MKLVDQSMAAMCAIVLGLGVVPTAVSGQTGSKSAGEHRQAAPASSDEKCANPGLDGEQIKAMLRSMQLEEKLSGLSERLAKEEAMSSPELAKLQNLSAQLEGKEGELEAQAEAMSSRAQEIASQVLQKDLERQNDGSVLISRDDDTGWLGVEIDEVTTQKAKDLKLPAVRGVVVEEVEPDSPAAKAGLKENDVILQYDNHSVEGTVQFRRLVRETPPGRSVSLTVMRNGQTQTLSVELADRSAYYEKRMRGMTRDFGKTFAFSAPNFEFHGPEMFTLMNSGGPVLGIEAEDLSGQLGAYFGAPGDSGVLVRSVREGTPAQKAGLKAGDVITKVNGAAVKSVSELRDQLREKREQKTVTLGVLRKGSEMNVSVDIEQPKRENLHAVHSAAL
jgi:serine protease Do